MNLYLVIIALMLVVTVIVEIIKKNNKYPNSVEVEEFFREYELGFSIESLIKDLLSYVPTKYLNGLSKIVVTNSLSLSHSRRRQKTWSRKKKYKISKCCGLYHGEKSGAWIELFIDNILGDDSKTILKIPLLRDYILGPILFHEVGHHIHKYVKPENREREDVADKWKNYFMKKTNIKYWYIVPLGWFLTKIKRVIMILKKYKEKKNFR